MKHVIFSISLVTGLGACGIADHQPDAGSTADRRPLPADADLPDAIPRSPTYWTRIPADEPRLRDNAGLAFDARSQRLMLLGGCLVTSPRGACYMVNDVWVLNLAGGLAQATWTELAPEYEPPTLTTTGFKVGYDPVSRRLLVLSFGADAIELWALENANGLGTPAWQPITVTGTEVPALRRGAAVSYDPERNRFTMFGGLRVADDAMLGDMWVLENANGVDGTAQWRALPTVDPQPESRAFAGNVLDPSLPRMFLFGGTTKDGWSLELGQSVTAQPIADTLTSGLVSNLVGFDTERNTLLFFGCHTGLTSYACRYETVWHLRLGNVAEPFREVAFPVYANTPYDWSPYRSGIYDPESDRFFLFGVGDADENPADVMWVLSNVAAGGQ